MNILQFRREIEILNFKIFVSETVFFYALLVLSWDKFLSLDRNIGGNCSHRLVFLAFLWDHLRKSQSAQKENLSQESTDEKLTENSIQFWCCHLAQHTELQTVHSEMKHLEWRETTNLNMWHFLVFDIQVIPAQEILITQLLAGFNAVRNAG